MAEIVNLRQARKRKARVRAEAKAAENRVRFGRDKPRRHRAKNEKDKAAAELDGKKLR